MRFFKHLTSLICAVVLVLCFLGADAYALNIASWYDSQTYTVLSDGKPSNSAVDCIILKIKNDGDVNQLHMLFMAELKSFGDSENAGVNISFDGYGAITLMCDGTGEYDDEVFFAEITDTLFDEKSMTMYLEVTVGIKDGIPDDKVMKFSLYDTDGVRSNTYSVEFEDEDDIQQEEEEKTSKTSRTRTTKRKTTRTTKRKTTKAKTTKTRTTKSKTSKSGKSAEDDYSVEEKSTVINLDEEIAVSNDREKIIIACTAAVIACAVGGCAVGIANIIKKKKDKKGTDQG